MAKLWDNQTAWIISFLYKDFLREVDKARRKLSSSWRLRTLCLSPTAPSWHEMGFATSCKCLLLVAPLPRCKEHGEKQYTWAFFFQELPPYIKLQNSRAAKLQSCSKVSSGNETYVIKSTTPLLHLPNEHVKAPVFYLTFLDTQTTYPLQSCNKSGFCVILKQSQKQMVS